MTGDQQDMFRRLKSYLPPWFGDDTPVLDGVLMGLASGWAALYALLAYVTLQTRIQNATDEWLDYVANDFFGSTLQRLPGQTDASFRNRIVANLFRPRATREGVDKVLYDLTGHHPLIVEPARLTDVEAYNHFYYGQAAYGALNLPQQAFVTAYRPKVAGVGYVDGYGQGPVRGRQFGTGDGSTTQFQLPSGLDYTQVTLYRTDWQGKQTLFATARSNQLIDSAAFDQAAWVKSALSVTANAAAAPDGSNTAAKLIADTTTAVHQAYQSVSSLTGTVTFSVFAKQGEYKYLCMSATGSAFNYAYFDLTKGTVALSDSTVNGAIENIGNGYYRCSITYTKGTSGGFPLVYPYGGTLPAAATTGPNFTGDGTSGLYAWGAQLESGSAPTAYIPTVAATVTVTDYTLNTSTGQATLASAPASGAVLTVDDDRTVIGPCTVGGYNTPSQLAYVDAAAALGSVSDNDIYAAVESVRPVGSILWLQVANAA